MTVRIPSSLKWLINRHARLVSEISRVENALREDQNAYRQLLIDHKESEAVSSSNLQARKAYLQQLKFDLQTIDGTFVFANLI